MAILVIAVLRPYRDFCDGRASEITSTHPVLAHALTDEW